MKKNIWIFLSVAVCTLSVANLAFAATPEQIDQSITKAKAFLYAQQKNGSWEVVGARKDTEHGRIFGSEYGGMTAIATYALLASGEKASDSRLAKSIDWLAKADMVGTYAIGLRAQVWPLVPSTPLVKTAARKDVTLLEQKMLSSGEGRGFYNYCLESNPDYDHSASQYAVLGMWACSQAGAEVSNQYWQEVDRAWRAHQQEDGLWHYRLNFKDETQVQTISMTAAGVATLLITQEFLTADSATRLHGNVEDKNIDAGLKWLSQTTPGNFEAFLREWRGFYALFGLSRIGVAGGYKYFGTLNWFEQGADQLIRNQAPDGSWNNGREGGPIHSTAFALLFLSRGRAAVAMNKLDYAGHWNQRPRDVANVTRWCGKQNEQNLNWQVVNLNVPVGELHDAPILYICGDQPLNFSDEEQSKLRQFVEEGGLILGNADDASKAFADSFRKLGEALFPDYEFRELPASHVIYTQEQFPRSKWKSPPSVLGLSNGARELMLLIPQADIARHWQSQQLAAHEDAHQLVADVYLYAIDRDTSRTKGRSSWISADSSIHAERTVKVARLRYDSNWDPEPGGWRRFANVLLNQFKVNLVVDPVKLGDGKLGDYFLAHLTGTTKFTLSDAQRAELKSFVEKGGTLIIDACGGSGEFATSAESELSAIFGDASQQLKDPLPVDHPMFSVRADKHATVGYRRFARDTLGSTKSPRLRGIVMGNRIAVFYSPEDLSVGLVGQNVDGILGYDPKSAVDCMTSMVLYAASQRK
jgi:hypothetical protein